ncbi:MAG: error-prone DNA polymerase, partial [Methylocystis sp.]|nr:error-prone DNA polymerase [Methylocystis sp.]
ALWAARRPPGAAPLPLFAAADARELAEEEDSRLPEMSLGEHVVADYQTTRLSLKAHPMALLREIFARKGILTCAEINAARDGAFVRAAGVVLVRQRPGNGAAIFVTLEDETGVANLVIWARLFERYRREIMGARLMLAQGRVQKSLEGVAHLMTTRVIDRTDDLGRLSQMQEVAPAPASHRRHPRNVRILPKSRDFH